MKPPPPAPRGFTLLEAMIALVLATGVVGTATMVALGSGELAQTSHVETRARSDLRRNLSAISDVLRGAAVASLEGFDADGRTDAPAFERAEGADLRSLLSGGPEWLEWRSEALVVSGVAQPGSVWHVTPTGERLVAARVPGDGFLVLQEGNVLTIRLTTYYATDREHVVLVTGEVAVALRN